MPATLSRRSALVTSLAGLLTACGQSNIAQIGDTAGLLWSRDTPVYDPAKARQLPYATLDAKLGRAAPAMLVLGEVERDQDLHWFSADRTQIITSNLRIIKTAGLPKNLGQTIWLPPTPLPLPPLADEQRQLRTIDLPESGIYSVLVKSTIRAASMEKIDIYGQKIQTQCFEEEVRAPLLDWHVTNTFWQDTTGLIWQAHQTISPEIPQFTLKLLKKYR